MFAMGVTLHCGVIECLAPFFINSIHTSTSIVIDPLHVSVDDVVGGHLMVATTGTGAQGLQVQGLHSWNCSVVDLPWNCGEHCCYGLYTLHLQDLKRRSVPAVLRNSQGAWYHTGGGHYWPNARGGACSTPSFRMWARRCVKCQMSNTPLLNSHHWSDDEMIMQGKCR